MRFHTIDEDLQYGPNSCDEDRECDCAHDYVRGYGSMYVEGCGDCAGYGVKPPVTHAIALSSPSEEDLVRLDLALREAEIPHITIREPDAPWNGQVMSIGIEPTKDKAKLRPFLRKYKLCASSSTVEQPDASADREKMGSTPSSRANARDPLGGYEGVKGCVASAGEQSEASSERFNSSPARQSGGSPEVSRPGPSTVVQIHPSAHTSGKADIGSDGGSNPPPDATDEAVRSLLGCEE